MRVNEVTDTLFELEQWAKKQAPLFEDGASAESLSKTILQKAVHKFKGQPEPDEAKTKEMQDYMNQLEMKLGTEKVEKTTIQKFFGFFRKHPRMIGLGVIILMLISPMLPSIAVIGLSLEKLLSMTLAGLYAIDIASPAVKTAMEL
tara:strand:- start:199 stop:636 length:438 start_codon:yes stop_codon:yes gene_type:complete